MIIHPVNALAFLTGPAGTLRGPGTSDLALEQRAARVFFMPSSRLVCTSPCLDQAHLSKLVGCVPVPISISGLSYDLKPVPKCPTFQLQLTLKLVIPTGQSFFRLICSQLNLDDSLARSFSSFLHPQSKPDLQKFQCRTITDTPRVTSPTHKPLRSSLRCSRRRLVSEPTSPRTAPPASTPPPPNPKCVHFKGTDNELESVCLFHATGRPSSISHPRSYSDTETETDTDNALAAQRRRGSDETMFKVTDISPIPSPHTPPESNIHLESLTLLPARPPLLRGIVRVRNISFEKSVIVHFTTDGWTTVSESRARYVGPGAGAGAWDQFVFTISLEMPRTLLLAVRYTVPGAGEWWDNNGGADFRVVLVPAKSLRSVPGPRPTRGFSVDGVDVASR